MLTTLIAEAYRQETGLAASLLGVLDRLEDTIKLIGSEYWVSNPADGRENFADIGVSAPRFAAIFSSGWRPPREDFSAIAQSSDRTAIEHRIRLALGEQLAQRIEASQALAGASEQARQPFHRHSGLRFESSCRPRTSAPPRWPLLQTRSASIESATFTRSGFRKQEFFK